jgi:hypothetical protein
MDQNFASLVALMRLRSFNEPHLQQRHAIMIAIPLSGRASYHAKYLLTCDSRKQHQQFTSTRLEYRVFRLALTTSMR